jgi:hypothetical protein
VAGELKIIVGLGDQTAATSATHHSGSDRISATATGLKDWARGQIGHKARFGQRKAALPTLTSADSDDDSGLRCRFRRTNAIVTVNVV